MIRKLILEQEELFFEFKGKKFYYTKKGNVLIFQTINVSHMNLKSLTELPWYGREYISKDFFCNSNKLTSLEGAPKEVEGHFNCSDNKLTSLVGAPEKIEGHFNCSDNKLTSLEGVPREINGSFLCYGNNLTSLKGAPEYIAGDFNCSYNKLISLKGAPKKVGNNFNCSDNIRQFTEENVRLVSNVKDYITI